MLVLYKKLHYIKGIQKLLVKLLISRAAQTNMMEAGSLQCSTTGVIKAMVCAVLSMGWCI